MRRATGIQRRRDRFSCQSAVGGRQVFHLLAYCSFRTGKAHRGTKWSHQGTTSSRINDSRDRRMCCPTSTPLGGFEKADERRSVLCFSHDDERWKEESARRAPARSIPVLFLAFASYTASGYIWMGSSPAPALKQNKPQGRDEGIPTCSHLKRCVCSIWCSITARSRS